MILLVWMFYFEDQALFSKLLKQGYLLKRLKSSNMKFFWSIWGSYSSNLPCLYSTFHLEYPLVLSRFCSTTWSVPLINAKCHSDPWPVTVTSRSIRLSTNYMTLISSLTFPELRAVSIEWLQRVWHTSRESLLFRTPVSVPLFGTC